MKLFELICNGNSFFYVIFLKVYRAMGMKHIKNKPPRGLVSIRLCLSFGCQFCRSGNLACYAS